MAKLISALLFSILSCSLTQAQDMHPDSVINRVFYALTADEPSVPANINEDLVGPEWEALAYWEMTSEKKKENMFEAVGDIYQFQPTSFAIKLRNPENAREFLSAITGSYRAEKTS